MIIDFIVGLVTGLISGCISGYIIYLVTKRKDRKYQVYLYWKTFLCTAMNECQIYMPSEALHNISDVGKSGSDWYKAITKILELQNPYPVEDKEFDERENEIAKNIIVALEELGKWEKKNHIK